jgi:hypothetical protein
MENEENLINEFEERMKVYTDTFNVSDAKSETFNFSTLFCNITALLESKDLIFCMSKLLNKCECGILDECNCDSENYIEVNSIKFNMYSNCLSSLSIECPSKIIKNDYCLFYIDSEYNEHKFMYIYKDTIVISYLLDRVVFDISDFNIREKNITIIFNYMSFCFK